MSLLTDLKIRFQDLDETAIDAYLPSYENVYQCYYNAEYGIDKCDDEIILNLLAHLISLDYNASNSGDASIPADNIASESVGNVGTSYQLSGNVSTSDTINFFNTTRFGRQYILLTKKNAMVYSV